MTFWLEEKIQIELTHAPPENKKASLLTPQKIKNRAYSRPTPKWEGLLEADWGFGPGSTPGRRAIPPGAHPICVSCTVRVCGCEEKNGYPPIWGMDFSLFVLQACCPLGARALVPTLYGCGSSRTPFWLKPPSMQHSSWHI